MPRRVRASTIRLFEFIRQPLILVANTSPTRPLYLVREIQPVFDFVKIDAPVLNNLSGFRRRSYATFTCCLRCNPPYEIVHSNVYTYAALGNDQLLLKHGNAVFIANKGPIMRVYTPFSL